MKELREGESWFYHAERRGVKFRVRQFRTQVPGTGLMYATGVRYELWSERPDAQGRPYWFLESGEAATVLAQDIAECDDGGSD